MDLADSAMCGRRQSASVPVEQDELTTCLSDLWRGDRRALLSRQGQIYSDLAGTLASGDLLLDCRIETRVDVAGRRRGCSFE